MYIDKTELIAADKITAKAVKNCKQQETVL